MRYGDLIELLDETGLSPERLAPYLCVSNMTYRRWGKKSRGDEMPESYGRIVAGGIYQLLEDGHLSLESAAVGSYLKTQLPEFFKAIAGPLGFAGDADAGGASQQDRAIAALARVGGSRSVHDRIDKAGGPLEKLGRLGEEWRDRIATLWNVVRSDRDMPHKSVAYGALFYLLTPFDLIPDTVPMVGYIDDFGILGFAMSFYTRRTAPDAA